MPMRSANSGMVIEGFPRQASKIFPAVFPTLSRRISCRVQRRFGRFTCEFLLFIWLPANNGSEQATVPVVSEDNIGPVGKGAFDARTDAVVGQHALGHVGGQNGVADIGVAGADFLNRQMVGEVSGADDLDPVAENKETDGCLD